MPVILIHGDNLLEIEEDVQAIRRRFDAADALTFDGKDVPFPSLSEASLTAGLFASERLVIVEDLHERIKGPRKDAELDEIRRLLANVPPTTTLLLVCRDMPESHALAHAVREAEGKLQARPMPRKGNLARWVAGRAERQGTVLDPGAAELLIDLAGSDPLLLDGEVQKLATYAGPGQPITSGMVEELVGAVPQDSIFALVDAVAVGDKAKALRLLHTQLDRASSGPIDFALYLIRMLARQMRILLGIRLRREAGRSTSQITAELKLPRYYADRYFRQANRLSTEKLCSSFEQLAALEYGLKSGTADAPSGLDLLVADLCS